MKPHVNSIAVASLLFVYFASGSAAQPEGAGQKKSLCGPEPLARCYKPPTCTPDGWVLGPMLPDGSACSTTSFQPGICDGGVCHPKPPTVTGSVSPAYYLVTIVYAPPGNKSKASYSEGSSAGNSTSAADMFGSGIKAGITGNVIATADFQNTVQTSQSFQVTKTAKSELDNNSTSDNVDHSQDMFYLWIDPVINYSQVQSPGVPVNISFGGSLTVVPFTAYDLMNRSGLSAHDQQLLKNFTDYDVKQILYADPWLASGYQPDSRYIKVDTLQLTGPREKGDPNYPGEGYSVDDSQVNCTVGTSSVTIGADFGGALGVDFFGQGEKATLVSSVFWRSTSSAGNCNGASQTAQVVLATTTVGYNDVIDIYEDSDYHTFTYVSESQGAGLSMSSLGVSGIVKNAAGKPAANQAIAVKFADGSTRRLFSDAQGNYRIFQVPAGPLTISAGGSARTVTFVPGKPIVRNFSVGHGPVPKKPLSANPQVN